MRSSGSRRVASSSPVTRCGGFEQRGLNLDAGQMQRLADAVGQAEQKGSRDSLVLLDELALVVSVQNHTVVTAMDGGKQGGGVFTNIDSVVIAH